VELPFSAQKNKRTVSDILNFGKIVLGEHNFSKKERKGPMLPQAKYAVIESKRFV